MDCLINLKFTDIVNKVVILIVMKQNYDFRYEMLIWLLDLKLNVVPSHKQ